MALTGGLLSFLGVEALFEAFELQAALPGALGGPGLVLLGVAISYLTMTFISTRFSAAGGGGVSAASRSRRSSRSGSACTTSARGSRSARRSRSAS